ncbi:MAG: arginine repressor [Gemmatimonadota bacterium]
MTADRKKRQLKILEMIATRAFRTQDELAEALTQEGWDVTQSSVSRDITRLGLVKSDGIYVRAAMQRLQEITDPNERRIAESVLTVETAGEALVVLHTPPGEAQRAGNALDLLAWPEIVGTIAGDDTIFIAVMHAEGQGLVARRLRALHGGGVE